MSADRPADTDEPQRMARLVRANLELCRVQPGETVAVLYDADEMLERAQIFAQAAAALGAKALLVRPRGAAAGGDASSKLANLGSNALTTDRAAMEALLGADMVVDLMLLLFSREQLRLQAAGARILMVVEPLEVLERLFPSTSLRRRVEAAQARLGAARTLRFTNRAGTDVSYELGGGHVLTEYGYTDTPGRWDHWPGGFLATVARPRGVRGRVVLDCGDIVYPLKRQLQEPVQFDIEGGLITHIDGGREAAELSEYMRGYGDPRAYSVSHIGWGLNEHCRWGVDTPGIGMDGRAYCGNVLFSTGPDTEFGGSNDTACHLDMPMRGCTLMLDGETIIRDGEILPPDMRAVRS
jgi:2,5-dihydroxypyridine 5,6-dioxygenase